MSYPIGARFEYKSKYSDDIIVGYIKEVGVGYYTPGMNKYVVSTKGATYNIEELKIETIADFREKKLKQIGL
jgi:hypothetical protein